MYRFCKRAFDIFAAMIGMIGTSPLWLIAIVGILVSDPGPIFYKARRIGRGGREFCMYKFRSMRVPRADETSEASFKADTNRIFPFGAFIRRVKIDELPQLLNILLGSMSVVGPRPAALDQVAVMRAGKYAVANRVRPGLTGPAALYDYIYGDEIEDPVEYERLVLPTRRELEAYYPAHMSAGYDLKLIWYTIVCVLAALVHREPKRIFAELTACVQTPAPEEEIAHV